MHKSVIQNSSNYKKIPLITCVLKLTCLSVGWKLGESSGFSSSMPEAVSRPEDRLGNHLTFNGGFYDYDNFETETAVSRTGRSQIDGCSSDRDGRSARQWIQLSSHQRELIT